MSNGLRWTEEQLASVRSSVARLSGGERVKGIPHDSPGLPSKPRRSKLGNQKQTIDGIVFASGLEARHYNRLRLLEQAGVISGLRVHTAWPLLIGAVEVGTWTSDFDYQQDGSLVVVDTKGFMDKYFIMIRKVFEALYPIRITIIRKSPRNSK